MMKNILGIVVLCLLLNGCDGKDTATVSSQVFAKNENYIELGKDDFSEIKGTTHTETRIHRNLASNHCSQYNKSAFQFANYYNDPEHGPMVATFFCYDRYVASKDGANLIWTNSSNTSSSSYSTNSGSQIVKSKQICKELGFKVNSEKFADCALKMMAMQFKTGNKVSNNDGSSTQQIIVKQQDDFDIGDFFFGLQKIVDDNYRSTNNSSNQGTNCRIVPKAWGADMVCR